MSDSQCLMYIVTESEKDDLFFWHCIQRISGKNFSYDPSEINNLRLRTGSGVPSLGRILRIGLTRWKNLANQNAYLIIAMDNDRAPEHPTHTRLAGLAKKDLAKGCRFCEIEQTIKEVWGKDSSQWPLKVAIAVPVQMIESWVLIAVDPQRDLSDCIFAGRNQQIAKDFYGRRVPDQLKNLCNQERDRKGQSTTEFFQDVADNLDITSLVAASPSFKQFHDQVSAW